MKPIEHDVQIKSTRESGSEGQVEGSQAGYVVGNRASVHSLISEEVAEL
jgi:hypothetical protein